MTTTLVCAVEKEQKDRYTISVDVDGRRRQVESKTNDFHVGQMVVYMQHGRWLDKRIGRDAVLVPHCSGVDVDFVEDEQVSRARAFFAAHSDNNHLSITIAPHAWKKFQLQPKDSHDVCEQHPPVLKRLRQAMLEHKRVLIVGHCSENGEEAQVLSIKDRFDIVLDRRQTRNDIEEVEGVVLATQLRAPGPLPWSVMCYDGLEDMLQQRKITTPTVVYVTADNAELEVHFYVTC